MNTTELFNMFMACKSYKDMYDLGRALVDDQGSGITNIKEALVLMLMLAQDKLKETRK